MNQRELSDAEKMLLLASGELSTAEAEVLRARIASDEGLAEQWRELSAMDGLLERDATMALKDAGQPSVKLRTLAGFRKQALVKAHASPTVAKSTGAGVPRWAWGVGIAAAVLLGVSIFLANRDPEVLIASTNQPVYQDEAPLVNYPGTWSEVFRTPEPNRLGLENEFDTELAALNSLREDLVFELDFSN